MSVLTLSSCANPPADDGTTGSTNTPPSTDGDEADIASGGGSADPTGQAVDGIEWLCPEPEVTPRFELGWHYKDGWIDLAEGGPLTITIGGQGAWMVPLGVRGEGFCVPADPAEYDHVPTLDISIDADGHVEPIAAVVDFPVSFKPIEEGGLGYSFIPMMIADAVNVDGLEGVATTIRAELLTRDQGPLEFVFNGRLTVSD